jgi:hypothetical protein
MGHFSGLAGGIALALIILPVVVRTTDRNVAARAEPDAMKAALSLGVPQWKSHSAGAVSLGDVRHPHRRVARPRAHQRRNRTAAVHRAQ